MSTLFEALNKLFVGFENGIDDWISTTKRGLELYSKEYAVRDDIEKLINDKTLKPDDLIRITKDIAYAYEQTCNRGLANISHGYISDEMPPTKNPLNPKEIFTSKSKLRARYREAGAEEVGTAYENGYDPSHRQREETQQFERRLHERFKAELNR